MLHRGDFLFVEHRDEPKILHIVANGTPEWISERFAATGSGDLFAHALLQKYARHPLSCAHAKLPAYKVMEEAIEVGAYGLGPPIDIWEVGPKGITQASEPEITGLKDAARLLREREVEMLTSSNKNSLPKK